MLRLLKEHSRPFLGWKVETKDNLKKREIHEEIRKISKKKISALSIFILSHGGIDGIMAYDDHFDLHVDIIRPLRADLSPCLSGKPKLIFVQVSFQQISLTY